MARRQGAVTVNQAVCSQCTSVPVYPYTQATLHDWMESSQSHPCAATSFQLNQAARSQCTSVPCTRTHWPRPHCARPRTHWPDPLGVPTLPAGTAEFQPGARHTLVVSMPGAGEMMLTASAGSIADFGSHNDGKLNYGAAVMCGGLRSNLRGDWNVAYFIWSAPPSTDPPSAAVTFRITTAMVGRCRFIGSTPVLKASIAFST